MNGIGLDLGDWVEEVEGMTCTCELSRAGAAITDQTKAARALGR